MRTKQKIKILTDPAEIPGRHPIVIQETRGSAAGQRPLKGGTPNGARTKYGYVKVGLRETFNADSVTIEWPGNSVTHTRAEVEGWLVGMNAARRLSDEVACREAVAETVRGKHKQSEDRRLKMEDSRVTNSETPDVVSYGGKSGRRGSGSATGRSALPTVAVLLIGLIGLTCRIACASEIIRGYAPADGQQLYAADLDNLVDESTIGVQFYNDQQTTPVLGAGYYFLILNPANQTYYRINAQQVLYGNTNFFLNAPPEGVPGYGVLLFYDPTNNWVASTTVSNFLWNSASNINVAGLSFANTNNAGAAMEFVLPKWPYPVLSGLNTNYPVHFLIFDTNGIPYREGLSNLESNMAFDLGTAFALPWEYAQEFAPWRLYGTNTASPYTNAFGWATNFPITAYFQPNYGDTLTNATLTDTDTVPVSSYQQGVAGSGAPTNTTMTLDSLYEYMTNKNALPPYTLARTQFSGYTATASITNMNNVTGIITNVPLAVNWTNPTPISFMGAATMIPTSAIIESNLVYWAQVTNGPVLSFQLFTNWFNALARTNPIQGNGVNPVNASTLYYVTNYTAVNCVIIQESLASSINTGVYGLWFTNFQPQNSLYYLSGSCQQVGGNGAPGLVSISYTQAPTTNNVNVLSSVGYGNSFSVAQFPLVQVLIQPE